ncbi:hypothetical protein NE237_027282 [Protea cynaroides]|uniref:HMA domain-containing protein n=1 Tax=Protea cynaroides TaxID=273540 RepID=A0A9Q0JU28_9MAGN|nr:hypothetical protein NE237_027282 [Protea cynaroides]
MGEVCSAKIFEEFYCVSIANISFSLSLQKENLNQNEDQKKDGGKKEDGLIIAILKVDMHCDGCAKKVKHAVKRFEDVEDVKGDFSSNKLTVVVKMDLVKLCKRVEQKTKKKVELISPLPKKDKDGGAGGGNGDKKMEEKPAKKPDDKKTKQVPFLRLLPTF